MLSYTPEGTPAVRREPDRLRVRGQRSRDQGRVQAAPAVHARHRGVGREARGAESHLGNTVQDFYVDSFPESYGDPQPVQVHREALAGRAVDALPDQRRGDQDGGHHRVHRRRALLPGRRRLLPPRARRGEGRRRPATRSRSGSRRRTASKRSDSFTYTARVESSNPVLIMSAEDYSGVMPNAAPEAGPKYLDYYTAALDGERRRLRRLRRRRARPARPAPARRAEPLRRGDLVHGRRLHDPRAGPGAGHRHVAAGARRGRRRARLPQRGRQAVLHRQERRPAVRRGLRVPQHRVPAAQRGPARAAGATPTLPEARDGCIAHTDDFLQYYLGAYIYVGGNPIDPETGEPFPMVGDGDPFGPLAWDFEADGAGNQDYARDLRRHELDPRPGAVPDVRVVAAAGARGTGRARRRSRRISGSFFMAAERTDEAYKRLHRTIDLTGATSGELKFWTSFDLEPDYDYTFVEAHDGRHGQLDDAAGRERPHVAGRRPELPDDRRRLGVADAAPVPRALPDGHRRRRHLHRRPGRPARGTRPPATPAAGRSGRSTCRAYAGKQVEISITVATDPAVQGLGVLGRRHRGHRRRREPTATSFEADLGGWDDRAAAAGHGEAGERLGSAPTCSSTRAASSGPTTASTPASASRASRAPTRPQSTFMEGVLKYLRGAC